MGGGPHLYSNCLYLHNTLHLGRANWAGWKALKGPLMKESSGHNYCKRHNNVGIEIIFFCACVRLSSPLWKSDFPKLREGGRLKQSPTFQGNLLLWYQRSKNIWLNHNTLNKGTMKSVWQPCNLNLFEIHKPRHNPRVCVRQWAACEYLCRHASICGCVFDVANRQMILLCPHSLEAEGSYT